MRVHWCKQERSSSFTHIPSHPPHTDRHCRSFSIWFDTHWCSIELHIVSMHNCTLWLNQLCHLQRGLRSFRCFRRCRDDSDQLATLLPCFYEIQEKLRAGAAKYRCPKYQRPDHSKNMEVILVGNSAKYRKKQGRIHIAFLLVLIVVFAKNGTSAWFQLVCDR